jgi:fumarylacetoacetate (FAA) hydrolase
MRLAHVRRLDARPGAPWRLVASLDPAGERWVDLETARARAAGLTAASHGSGLLTDPLTTLDAHLARGRRIAELEPLAAGFMPRDEHDDAVLDSATLRFGPPILGPASFRDFFAFEAHVRATWSRGQRPVPDTWYRLPVFYFQNVSEILGPGNPVAAPRGSAELDFELEVAALVDTEALDLPEERAEAAIGGYLVLNDWSARDLQREETALGLGAAKGKDFATSIGPWLVTPDELAPRRATGATAPDLAMSVTIRTRDDRTVELPTGRLSDAHFSFGAMLARASAGARLRPGDLLASGTVGGGCLLEARGTTLGRYLEPGDEVTLEVEGLGRLVSPIVGR